MKRKINFFYPVGNILSPTTGGEIYDNHVYSELNQHNDLVVEIIDSPAKSRFQILKTGLKRFANANNGNIFIFNSRICIYIFPALLRNKIVKRCKTIVIHHHFAYEEMTGFKRFLMRNLERKCLNFCDEIITPNPYVLDCIKNTVRSNGIRFIGHPFAHSPRQKSVYKKFNILFVGTVYQRKGLDLLIKAVNRLPESMRQKIRLNLVGKIEDKSYYQKLLKLVHHYGLSDTVNFVGRVSDSELIKLYQNAYCFVLPSRHEGYGLVIEEAMSYGLPVIGFDNSAMPYTILNNQNGLLVKDGDIDGLKNAIERLMSDCDLHSKLAGGALISYSKSHDLTDFKKEINDLIIDLTY